MQCTPESNVQPQNYKPQHSYDYTDSGYSDLFHSPRNIIGMDSCSSMFPAEFNDTPKENFRFTVTPKEKSRESKSLGTDCREVQQSSAVNWCETPKVCKRNASLRHRLPMCKPATVNNNSTTSLSTTTTESTFSVMSEQRLHASFESLDIMTDGPSNTLKLDQDLFLSGGKRRLFFTQMRTSTLQDDRLDACHLPSFERSVSLIETEISENISSDQMDLDTPGFGKLLPVFTPEISDSNILCDNASFFCTPTSVQTPKDIRSACEDSGFCSLTLDKSQDSSVDHNGSFHELLISASRGNGETPNLSDTKRRSRFQRQYRLSTLKEGGSQSEEDPVEIKHHWPSECDSYSKKDEVFEEATPSSLQSAKYFSSFSSAKHVWRTPLRASTSKLENTTRNCSDSSDPAVTPLRTTPINLSLTPALQLVHTLCQHKARMFPGRSPSLEEELKSTVALAKSPVTFRMTMPLAGLIGRKMGLVKVDILTELKKRNLKHVLAILLSKLNAETIYRCGKVCKIWREIIQQDSYASLRRRNYLSEVEAALEHGGAVHVSVAETRYALSKRSALKTVQAQSRTLSYSTPQSANSTLTSLQHSASSTASGSKREKFLEVAKTLFVDESLKPCPRCQHPARCHSVKGEGVCSRADCGFQFCISCMCAFHGSRDCGSQPAGRHKKDNLLPGSARSKRNIRRL